MPNKLSYSEYYIQQMGFIDDYLNLLATGSSPSIDQARIQRMKQREPQQSIHFLDEFLEITPGKELETTRIGYWPRKDRTYPNIQLAPEAALISGKDRRLSRSRLVHGPVDFYLDSQLEQPTTISVITACAPNLMGSSAIDLAEFSTGTAKDNRQLQANKYKTECEKLASFIVSNAKTQGHNELIMPAFGVGVYINTLEPASRLLATEIMYKAFAQAASAYQIDIKWIVWAGDKDPHKKAQLLQSHSNQYMQPIIAHDMLAYTQERIKAGTNVVMLNPGSDRTIGGLYIHEHPKTLEEQFAQQSDLVMLHSEFNQSMVNRFHQEFNQRKLAQPNFGPAVKPKPQTNSLNDLANQIKNTIGMDEHPWIIQEGTNYKISFKKQNNTSQLVDFLYERGISGKDGNKKTIQNKDGYFVIFLTSRQYLELPVALNKKSIVPEPLNPQPLKNSPQINSPSTKIDLLPPTTHAPNTSSASIMLTIGAGFFAGAGVAGIVLGALALASILTFIIPPLAIALVAGGAAALGAGITGMYFFSKDLSANTDKSNENAFKP
jgi:hypothetical protein